MLGFGRPSLRTRPSLLDLVKKRDDDFRPLLPSSSSVRRNSVLQLGDLPPLPPSPLASNFKPSNYSVNSSPETPSTSTHTSPTPTMPPKDSKKTRQEADDEQNGSIFSVSGPVVVAENMIGCAMYELVRARARAFAGGSSFLIVWSSAVSDTIN